jgi:hypothetical protein
MQKSSHYKNDSKLVGICLDQSGGSARKRHVGGHACLPRTTRKSILPANPQDPTTITVDDPEKAKAAFNERNELEADIAIPERELQDLKAKVLSQYMYDAYINEID